jgi:hypothetical protein
MMPAYALDYADGKVQAHGFLSQGIVFTDDNNFLGTSQNGSVDFREVGVNLSWRPNPDFQMSGQLLSHRAGESDVGNVRVDYAFADLTALSSETKRGGVRIGRVKTPYGLYNKTRDVAFTRPSIILPQSIYFERTRNLAIATDGVEFYLEHNGETGNLYLNAALGWQDASDQATEVAFLGKRHPGKLTSGFDQFLQVMYEGDGGRYRLGMTASWINLDYQRRDDLVLKSGHQDFDPIIFSGQYNAEHWNLTGEYAVRPSKTSGYGAIPDSRIIGESYYLQGAYQVLPKLEALLRYDVFYGNRDDRDGKAFETASKRPAFTRFAKDWTMGLRYDVTPAFMVAAEYHRVNGTGWLPVLDNPDATTLKQHWDMFMLLGSFRF